MRVVCLKRNGTKVFVWNSKCKTRISSLIKLLRNHWLNKRLPRINFPCGVTANNKRRILKHGFVTSEGWNLFHFNHRIRNLCARFNICCSNNNWNKVFCFVQSRKDTKSCDTRKTYATSQEHFAVIIYTHTYLLTHAGDV